MRTLNDTTINMIKGFEGLCLNAYKDSGGIPTIGYGHTKGVKLGDTITEAEAITFLNQDLEETQKAIDDVIDLHNLTDNEYGAIVSLVFNVGVTPLQRTLGNALCNGDYDLAAKQFPRWDNVRINGVETRSQGLLNRRLAEQKLFMS